MVVYSIEHLNGPSLAVFPQMIFGTFRPKIVLITTPNFEVSRNNQSEPSQRKRLLVCLAPLPQLNIFAPTRKQFNSKFPRSHSHDGCDGHGHDGSESAAAPGTSKGFLDPTGRTERVFRHSDHKLEMTEQEFRDWCESAEGEFLEGGGDVVRHGGAG